jgi:hypothetical protein
VRGAKSRDVSASSSELRRTDDRPAHTLVTKGASSMGPEEAEGQITHRSCFTKDQLLDPDCLESEDRLSGVTDG